MIKVKNSATALLLAFSMLCSIIIMTPVANAEARDSNLMDPYITGVEIVYTNDSGQHTVNITEPEPGPVEIQAGTTVRLTYDFTLPDKLEIQNGAQYTLFLPANLPVADNFKGKTGDIGKLGTYKINDDQTVTLTFNQYAAEHKSRGGNFYVETSFSGTSEDGSSDQELEFNINGETVTVPVTTVYAVEDPSIEKDGSYDKDSGVTWTVTIHSGSDRDHAGLTNAVVTDTLGEHQTFEGASLKIGDDSQPIAEGDDGTETPYYKKLENGKIEFHLGDIPANTDAAIIYTPTVSNDIYQSDQDQVTLTNKAELGADNITKTPSDDDTVDVPVDWIYKGGEYDAPNQQIKWTIQVNPRNQHLPAGATVTDTLAKFLNLDTDTVQVNGSDIPDKTGATGKINDAIYYTTSSSGGQTTVIFHFAEATTAQQTITFTTKIDDKYYNTNSGGFTNKATLTTPENNQGIGEERSSTTGTIVGTATHVIEKGTSGSYNPSTHQLSWKITVNSNKIAIQNPVVTDTIDPKSSETERDHQKIISVTAVKHNGDPDIPDVPVTLNAGTDADTGTVPFYFIDGKTLTVHLKDFAAGDDPVVLTVVSEVTDPAYYAVNDTHTVYNTAVLTGTSDTGDVNESATASQEVTSKVIEKTALGYGYDDSHLISWKIDVNQNGMTMTDAVITDTIPAGLTLKEDSVTFGDTAVKKQTAPGGAAPYYTLTDSLLTIHLGDLSAAGTIQYQTAVDIGQFQDNNQALSYENTANLRFGNGTDSGESDTDTKIIAHSVIEKGFEYTSGNLYIDWKVLINRNQVPIGNGTDKVIKVTDTLQEGLSLDTGSVAFYPVTTADNGNTFTNGAPVSLQRGNVGYNEATREFVFTFPKDTDLSKAYRLEFRTFVTDKTKSPFQNKVNFQGVIKAPDSTSGLVAVVDQSAGGDGWGSLPLGSITVLKQDRKDKTPLSGAEFTLYDVYGNPVQILTTDGDGKAVFSRLSYGTYSLRETKTPDGYKKSTYYKSGIVVKADSRNITLTVDNTKIGNPGHSGGGGGGGSSSDTTSSGTSSVNPSSVNPTESIGEDPTGQAGPGSSSSANPNETVGDDDVGKFGPSPKTGETPISLPALGTAMGAAILAVVVLRKKITRE